MVSGEPFMGYLYGFFLLFWQVYCPLAA